MEIYGIEKYEEYSTIEGIFNSEEKAYDYIKKHNLEDCYVSYMGTYKNKKEVKKEYKNYKLNTIKKPLNYRGMKKALVVSIIFNIIFMIALVLLLNN